MGELGEIADETVPVFIVNNFLVHQSEIGEILVCVLWVMLHHRIYGKVTWVKAWSYSDCQGFIAIFQSVVSSPWATAVLSYSRMT